MPSAMLTGNSVLMGESGWSLLDEETRNLSVYGSDRHGQLSLCPVSVEPLGRSGPVAMIGTGATFGAFADESRLILRDGGALTAAQIVQESDLDDLWFENVAKLPSGVGGIGASAQIYNGLKRTACFSGNGRLARRCVSRNVRDWEQASSLCLCEYRQIANDLFCVVSETAIRNAQSKGWQNVAVALLTALSKNSEEDVVQFDMKDTLLALWFGSALSALGLGYTWLYDSLQYSLLAKAQLSVDHRSPFQNARCAFFQTLQSRIIRMAWQKSSWTPVVGGFFVEPN